MTSCEPVKWYYYFFKKSSRSCYLNYVFPFRIITKSQADKWNSEKCFFRLIYLCMYLCLSTTGISEGDFSASLYSQKTFSRTYRRVLYLLAQVWDLPLSSISLSPISYFYSCSNCWLRSSFPHFFNRNENDHSPRLFALAAVASQIYDTSGISYVHFRRRSR